MEEFFVLLAANNEENSEEREKTKMLRLSLIDELDQMSESKLISSTRLNRGSFDQLVITLEQRGLTSSLNCSVQLKVFVALSFLSSGSHQKIVAHGGKMSQTTVSICLSEVVDALNLLVNEYITFPTTQEEKSANKLKFLQKHNFPGVIGVVDGSHIGMVAPRRNEQNFINRKGYHSLNAQIVCDSNMMIISANARFGGSTHDAYVWRSSQLNVHMEALYHGGESSWLLGDSGYPQRPWLMTPILGEEITPQEAEYTRRHIQARCTIERCIGVLKARWRCLLKQHLLHYSPEKAAKIFYACCVLHNIARANNLPVPILPIEEHNHENDEDESDSDSDEEAEREVQVHNDAGFLLIGRSVRALLVQQMNI